MNNFSSEFNKFLDTIQLGKTRVDNLRRSREAIRERIISYYKDNGKKAPQFCGQGSFKAHTCINQSDEDYDIDDGVYLNHLPDNKGDWPSAETVHKEIKEAVTGHTDLTPLDKRSCVRVQFKREYHVDLAIYGEYDGKIYLAKKGDEQWEENNPKVFTQWFKDKVAVQGEQLRSICKYIKKWAYYNGWSDTICGFHITILVGNNFQGYTDRDDIALTNTLSAIIRDLSGNRRIIRPVYPYKDMLASLSETEKDTMIQRFSDFRDSAQESMSGRDREEAHQIWRRLFGNDFPKFQENGESRINSFAIVRENKPWGNVI